MDCTTLRKYIYRKNNFQCTENTKTIWNFRISEKAEGYVVREWEGIDAYPWIISKNYIISLGECKLIYPL